MKIKEQKQKSSLGDQEEKKKKEKRMRNGFETWVLAMAIGLFEIEGADWR